jgi:hypothetical protein
MCSRDFYAQCESSSHSLAREREHFLAVGQATEGYPVILRNRELDVIAAGETRYRFLEP